MSDERIPEHQKNPYSCMLEILAPMLQSDAAHRFVEHVERAIFEAGRGEASKFLPRNIAGIADEAIALAEEAAVNATMAALPQKPKVMDPAVFAATLTPAQKAALLAQLTAPVPA